MSSRYDKDEALNTVCSFCKSGDKSGTRVYTWEGDYFLCVDCNNRWEQVLTALFRNMASGGTMPPGIIRVFCGASR